VSRLSGICTTRSCLIYHFLGRVPVASTRDLVRARVLRIARRVDFPGYVRLTCFSKLFFRKRVTVASTRDLVRARVLRIARRVDFPGISRPCTTHFFYYFSGASYRCQHPRLGSSQGPAYILESQSVFSRLCSFFRCELYCIWIIISTLYSWQFRLLFCGLRYMMLRNWIMQSYSILCLRFVDHLSILSLRFEIRLF
jgi:hypothetical protein